METRHDILNAVYDTKLLSEPRKKNNSSGKPCKSQVSL